MRVKKLPLYRMAKYTGTRAGLELHFPVYSFIWVTLYTKLTFDSTLKYINCSVQTVLHKNCFIKFASHQHIFTFKERNGNFKM